MENKQQVRYILAKYVKSKKRPYIEFWAFCHLKQKLVRVRRYPKTFALGMEMVRLYNEKLKAGQELNRQSKPSIEFAMNLVWEKKVLNRPDTVRSYKSHHKQFMQYCNEQKLSALPIDQLTKVHILDYLDNSMLCKGNTAKTRNTKMKNLRTFFNFLLERDIITKNPCMNIKRLKEQQSTTQAIAPALVPVIRELIKKENPTLFLFNSFVYYCFIRPKELLLLDWTNIDGKNSKIFVPATISKNNKSEWIVIPKSLQEILKEYYPDGLPAAGKVFTPAYNTLLLHQKNILKAHGLPKYGLYEWKHTGVTAFFKAGVNIKYIQQQCRHSSLDYTDHYLKGLGLIDNADAFDNIPKI